MDVKGILKVFGLNGSTVYDMLEKKLTAEINTRTAASSDLIVLTLEREAGELIAAFNYLERTPNRFLNRLDRYAMTKVIDATIEAANSDIITRQLLKAVDVTSVKNMAFSAIHSLMDAGEGNCIAITLSPNGKNMVCHMAEKSGLKVTKLGQLLDMRAAFSKM